MSLDQAETFEWLLERHRKLLRIENVLERNVELRVNLALELASENVRPIVQRELEAEQRMRSLKL